MKKLSLVITILLVGQLSAQKYLSKSNEVVFFSEATIENITATNTKSTSAFDIKTGKVAFSIPISQFEFEKSLMKEHFNDNYMESEKYPKSTFVGVIEGYEAKSKERQKATAKGVLTIHGVEQEIETEGWITFDKKTILIESEFWVKLKDYEIKIPQLLFQNIAEEIEVKVKFEYEPYE